MNTDNHILQQDSFFVQLYMNAHAKNGRQIDGTAFTTRRFDSVRTYIFFFTDSLLFFSIVYIVAYCVICNYVIKLNEIGWV